MSETARLAQFCSSLTFEQLPGEVVGVVKRIVLDSIGTTLAGGSLGEGCAQLCAAARATSATPQATLLGLGERVSALPAALGNGGMGHALNFDAGGDAGHVGSVLAAPLAAAELRGGVAGRAFIAGFAAGLELMARLARAVEPARFADRRPADRLLEGQLLGYFAAAAASGAILGLSPAQMHSAFGLALMQAAGTMQVVYDGDPPAKAIYAAFSNHGGLLSALLAQQGLGAPIAAFEGRAGLLALHYGGGDPAELTRDLGDDYRILDVAFKPWPSSGVTHPFIEAAQALGRVEPSEIQGIRLRGGTHSRAWFEPENVRRRPATGAAAANSIFYTVARTFASGTVRLEDFAVTALPAANALIDRMTHSIDDDLGSSAVVEVLACDGRVRSKRVDGRLGTSAKPMSDAQLHAKFVDCAAFAARPVTTEALADLLWNLEQVPDLMRVTALC